jgi:DNA helicase-2/ATP-dependent DNA helicase PcrA
MATPPRSAMACCSELDHAAFVTAYERDRDVLLREFGSNDFFDTGNERERPARQIGRVGSASTAVTRMASPPRGNYPFTIGQNVFHTKFGEGRVTGLEGNDADARAQVNFKRHGVKWLQLSIAKLAAID